MRLWSWGLLASACLWPAACHKYEPKAKERVYLRSAEAVVFEEPLVFRVTTPHRWAYLDVVYQDEELRFLVKQLPTTITINLAPLLKDGREKFSLEHVSEDSPKRYSGLNQSSFHEGDRSLDFLIGEAIGNGYYGSGPDVYYSDSKMEDCDRQSFQILSRDPLISRDAKRVYHYSSRIVDADGETYEVLGQGYGRDARAVFYEAKKLPVMDPKKFTLLTNPVWGKDDVNVFYSGEALIGARPGSFVALSSAYAKDDQSVYFATRKLEANPATFRSAGAPEPFNNLYALDGNAAFYQGYKLNLTRPADLKTFDQDIQGTRVHPRYATDGVTLLYEGVPVPAVDVATFQVTIQIGDWLFARDKNSCYVGNAAETLKNCDQYIRDYAVQR